MEEFQYTPEQQRSPNRFQQQEEQIYSKGIREIEKSQEFQSRYEAQVQSQSLAENKIGELEILLERERKRTREIRSDLIKELEKEKMLRQHAEENLISIKDQAIKGEQENSKAIQDLELKLNNIQNDKQQLIIELKRQKDQLGRVQTNTSENARILEEKLLQQARMTAQLEENSRQQQDRLKVERINELRELQNE